MAYIDKDKLISMTVKKNSIWDSVTDSQGRGLSEIINSIPTADVVEVKRGKWTHDGSKWANRFICSECGYKLFDEPTNFCPTCGAKMR